MLGLANGLQYEGSIVVDNPQDVSGKLIAWWDFTDVDQLYQTRTSYDTAVSSDGDLIGRCKNKVYEDTGYLANPAAGAFIRAALDSNRPTYKTDGAGGNSYALFDGSNTGLACRSSSTAWGAHLEDKLSSGLYSLIVNTSLSIWIIGEPADNDTDGTNEVALSYFGYRGTDTSYADEEQTTLFTFEREDDEDLEARWVLSSSGSTTPPVSPNSITATQPASHWESGKATVINISANSGNGASNIYVNGVVDVAQTVFDTNPAINTELRQEGYITLDNSWDDTKVASFGVGGQVSSTGTIGPTFEGKIYEILIYSLTTPNISEIASLNSYFVEKYNIT